MFRRFGLISLIIFSMSVISVSADVWKDDFAADKINEKWTTAVSWSGKPQPPTDWKVENGVLKGHWPTWGQQHLLIEYPSPEYTVQVKCRFDNIIQENNGNGAGIVFCSSGPDKTTPNQGSVDFYVFAIGPTPNPGGASIWRIGDGWWDVLVGAATQEPIRVGEWYTLKLAVKGNNFLGYVNDELVFEAQDNSFKGSSVGLFMSLYVDASFDDFMITDEVNSVSAVDVNGKLPVTWGCMKAGR